MPIKYLHAYPWVWVVHLTTLYTQKKELQTFLLTTDNNIQEKLNKCERLLTCNIVCVYDQFMNLEEKLYTSTEVADILGVSLRSVYRYMEEYKLKADVKTATGRHRFTKQNILDFLYPEGSARPSQQPQTAVRPKVVSEEPVYPSEPLKPRPIQEQVVEKTPEPIQEPLKEEQES